jgi:hypothetical protein
MKRLKGLVLALLVYTSAAAQENSPYSRYGLGDLVPNQNILNRGMGGIAAGYSDYQSINFVNPASYGNLSYTLNPNYIRNTIFDIGAEVDTRVLKSVNPSAKFSATNLLISYLQLGLPVKLKKANKKGIFLGFSLGLKPVSRINYKVFKTGRDAGDSSLTVNEGSGGISEANIGAGIRIKNFNIGFNAGYRFGNKDFSNVRTLLNDTVVYYSGNFANKANFGSFFVNAGVQYELKMKNASVLRFGAYGNLKKNVSATQDVIRETVSYNASGERVRVDSVYEKNVKGVIVYPATFGAGFTYQDSSSHWMFGADYETTYWDAYRFFGEKDNVKNSWKVRAGAEFLPATAGRTPLKKYFSFVRYRAGVYYGPDYINLGSNVSEYGITFGAGFPLKLRRGYYETQSSLMNTSIEFGRRGSNKNNLRENTFRISVGFSLSDLWFNRAKYN